MNEIKKCGYYIILDSWPYMKKLVSFLESGKILV